MIWGILILRISVGCSHRKQNIFWERNHFETNDLNSDGKDHEQPEPVEWNSLISDSRGALRINLSLDRQETKEQTRRHALNLTPPASVAPLTSILAYQPSYPEYLRTLTNLKPFFGGFVGLRGDAKIFAMETPDSPKGFSYFFPMVIQVLSREYGCFVKIRMSWVDRHQFSCRDKRNIVVWYQPVFGWSQLVFRQFDRQGYEIRVRQRAIRRISARKVLDRPLSPDQLTPGS